MAYYIGLDLGGTNVKAGVVDDQARVLSRDSRPTQAQDGPQAVIRNMIAAAATVAGQAKLPMSEIAGIGIGAPGPLDYDLGTVKAAPNMPGWKDVPLRDEIAKGTGRPAVLENDANAAGFGEFWAGAGKAGNGSSRGKPIRDMVMFTLGTGIGSGIIVEGKILHGAFGLGGEAGHMIIVPGGRQCGCGQKGCFEQYASASNVGKRAQEAIDKGEASTLSKLRQAGHPVTAKDVFDAATAGDALACRIVDETATYLGIGCANICRIIDPQMIVFAGGMILAGDFLFDRVRKAFTEQSWKVAQDDVQIVPARLGNDAGFIGAAAVAMDSMSD